MAPAATVVCLLMLSLCLMHIVLTGLYYLRTARSLPAYTEDQLPRVGVVLSLRGADAFLGDALRGLIGQDYPDYTVEIIVDSEQDPAYTFLQSLIGQLSTSRIRVSVLKNRRSTCSLKNSALIEAAERLSADHDIIAFLDADVVPHPTWLRELVAPFADARIGATTGNRWYEPLTPGYGSLARAAWNAGAVVQMAVFEIAWGGSLAIRSTVLADSKLYHRWGKSFNDDQVLGSIVKKRGLRLQFVPGLMMVNRETIAFRNCCNWVGRQLLHLRFYQPNWPAVAICGWLSTVLPVAACALAALGLITGQSDAVVPSIAGLLAYLATMTGLYLVVSARVHQLAGGRVPAPVRPSLRAVVAVLASLVAFSAALYDASLRRTVNWRGITYRIHSRWRVELLEYRPYQPATTAEVGLSI